VKAVKYCFVSSCTVCFSLVTDFVFLAAILFADSERTQLINMNKPIEPDAFDPNFILPMFRNR